MGVGEILDEWTAWRTDCVKRRIFFQISKEEGQAASAARVWNESCWTSTRPSPSSGRPKLESEVVPNLMIGFGIDEIQANYVAEIKLRNINKEYILKQTQCH